jgi:uncharacterized protein YndB with AHSA1/START domain
MTNNNTTAPAVARDLNLVRTFNAPKELVFEAWIEPKHIVNWFAPNGFTTPVAEFDARPEGDIRVCMKGPDGTEYWSSGHVREIETPNKLVVDTGVEGEDGKFLFETRMTASFEEVNGRTVLNLNDKVLSVNDPAAESSLEGMEQGWNETLDKFADYIQSPSLEGAES